MRKRGRRDLDLDKVGCGDQTYTRAALDPHLTIGIETCAPRPGSTPTEERAERIGVPVRIAGPVLDACVDDVELEGEDVLEDVRARVEGGSMVARAPNRFVASAEAWLKRRRRARDERRRDQSYVRGVSQR